MLMHYIRRRHAQFISEIKSNEISIIEKFRYVGIIFILVAWFLLSLDVLIFHRVSYLSIPMWVSLFWKFVGALIFYLPIAIFSILYKGAKETCCYLWPNKPWFVISRGIIGVGTLFALTLSIRECSTIENTIIFSSEAIIVPLILKLLLKNKIKAAIWIGIIIGFVGVSWTYFGGDNLSFINKGGMYSFIGAVGMAILIVMTSYMVKNDPPLRIAFFQIVIGVVCATIGASITSTWVKLPFQEITLLLISGFFYSTALFLFLDAFYYTESYIIGMLSFSLVGFYEISNVILNIPQKREIIGPSLILIVIGGLIVILSSYHLNKKKSWIKL